MNVQWLVGKWQAYNAQYFDNQLKSIEIVIANDLGFANATYDIGKISISQALFNVWERIEIERITADCLLHEMIHQSVCEIYHVPHGDKRHRSHRHKHWIAECERLLPLLGLPELRLRDPLRLAHFPHSYTKSTYYKKLSDTREIGETIIKGTIDCDTFASWLKTPYVTVPHDVVYQDD